MRLQPERPAQRRHTALLRASQDDPRPLGQRLRRVRFRDNASKDARSASDNTSGTSFGLGASRAYNLQSFL